MLVTASRDREKPSRRLGDVHAVAELLDCSPAHVRRLAESGRMPAALKIGGCCRWDLAKVESWLADGAPCVDRRAAR
jgi:predicted DNA-binding transcriptional regulator AlpA